MDGTAGPSTGCPPPRDMNGLLSSHFSGPPRVRRHGGTTPNNSAVRGCVWTPALTLAAKQGRRKRSRMGYTVERLSHRDIGKHAVFSAPPSPLPFPLLSALPAGIARVIYFPIPPACVRARVGPVAPAAGVVPAEPCYLPQPTLFPAPRRASAPAAVAAEGRAGGRRGVCSAVWVLLRPRACRRPGRERT